MGLTNSTTSSSATTTAKDVESCPPVYVVSDVAEPQGQQDGETKCGKICKYNKHTILATNSKVKLLSLRPINESQDYHDSNVRRRSSIKNLILGDAAGPRFSQDLCSLSSGLSDYSFGIEFSRDSDHVNYNQHQNIAANAGGTATTFKEAAGQQTKDTKKILKLPDYPIGDHQGKKRQQHVKALASYPSRQIVGSRRLSASMTLASVDLNSSFDSNLLQVKRPIFGGGSMVKNNSDTSLASMVQYGHKYDLGDGRKQQFGKNIKKSIASNLSKTKKLQISKPKEDTKLSSDVAHLNPLNETKLIILMQVCIPFILAGFGNLAAGLVVNRIIVWSVFKEIPAFIIMLTAFVGFKGNIEMTMASRLSTLANLGMLDTGWQMKRAYISNLFLVCSQAITLSLFAALLALGVDFLIVFKWSSEQAIIVLASSLLTSLILVIISSVVIIITVLSAKWISVNPDNLSTLVSALYGDVSAIYIYALVANYIFAIDYTFGPMIIVCSSITIWPLVTLCAYRYDETQAIALTSNIPIMIGIVVSLISGFIFSKVYTIYTRMSLFHPVVNGFGANLIAVQASRVSTWLWCSALDKLELTSAKDCRKLSSLDCRRLHSTGSIRVKYLGKKNPYMHQETTIHHCDEYTNDTKRDHHHHPKQLKLPESTTTTSTTSSSITLNGSKNKLVQDYCDATNSSGFKWFCGGSWCWCWSVVGSGDKREENGCHFSKSIITISKRVFKAIFWSYLGPSPNAKAAKMLLVMMVVAQSIYFFVIWLVVANNIDTTTTTAIKPTFFFYGTYVTLCLVQVGLLLMICEPLMTLLMSKNLDPDTYGITILMASADLLGTICLTLGFQLLAKIHDPNAS